MQIACHKVLFFVYKECFQFDGEASLQREFEAFLIAEALIKNSFLTGRLEKKIKINEQDEVGGTLKMTASC